jgi:hypothetical protein
VAVDGSVVKKLQRAVDPPSRQSKPERQTSRKAARDQHGNVSRSAAASHAVYGGGAFGKARSRTRK